MRAKRIVTAVALCALMAGGAAFAAEDNRAGDNSPTATDGNTEVFQSDDVQRKVARFRGRWGQVRGQAPRAGDYSQDSCSSSPMTRLFAGLFGFQDVVRPCENRDGE